MQGSALDPLPGGDLAGQADDQRHVERVFVYAVVIVPALVLVESFAVVAVDDDQGVVLEAQLGDAGNDALDAGVHIGNGAVVLRIDIVAVGDPGRHPFGKEIAKGLESEDRLHRFVLGVEFIAAIEHPLEGRRRQVGRVRVHVAQEEQERFLRARQPLELGDGDLVEVFGLGAASLGERSPAGVV